MNKQKEAPDNLTICKFCHLSESCSQLTREQADYDETGKCVIDCKFFCRSPEGGVDHAKTSH